MKNVLMCILTLLSFGIVHAQETSEVCTTSDTLQIYFRHDKVTLEPRYRNNSKRLQDFASLYERLQENPRNKVRKILILSGASPEGPSTYNRYLSDSRAKVVHDYIVDNHLADPAYIEVESLGADWDGLGEKVRASNLPYKDEVLEMLALPEWISRNGKVVDGRKYRLMNFQGGKVWKELSSLYYADLRGTRVIITYDKMDDSTQEPETETIVLSDTVYLEKKDTVYIDRLAALVVGTTHVRKPFQMAVKSNLLYDAIIVPNIGIEIGLGNGLALSGSYQNIWLTANDWIPGNRIEGLEAGLKWYINKERRAFKGHHIDIYGQMLTWDVTYGGRGYLADRWVYGASIAYGYALPIGRHLNLDFELGVGYLNGKMHKYIPMDGHSVWQSAEHFQWLGPTKIGVTLQWLIGCSNRMEKKKEKGR